MSLKERLNEDMKTAMKAKDDLRLSVIRMVRSSIKNKEIDQKGEMDDRGVTEILSTLVKQRRESLKMFTDGGRDDLAQKEEKELGILLEFLPQQLTQVELEEMIARIVQETGAQGPKDMGKVMKVLQPAIAGRADGKMVSELVRLKLA